MIEMSINGFPVDPRVYHDVEEIPAIVIHSVAEDGSEEWGWKRDPDVVKVVRCRACRHIYGSAGTECCELTGAYVELDDYCSYAREWDDGDR